MKIEKLKSDDTKEFKYLMQAAFQYGYESIFGKSDSEILPEKEGGMFEFEKIINE